MQLIEDVFCYPWQGQGNNCNTYVLRFDLEGNDRYALIDPGLTAVPAPIVNGGRVVGMGQEPGLDLLLSRLKSDDIDPAAVELVINTHAHADHCESSLWWKENHGALIAGHESETPFYLQAFRGHVNRRGLDEDAAQPDLFLTEGELHLGKPRTSNLQVYHTPGHSPGSISLYWPERRVLIVGDLVFFRSVGRSDLPGGTTAKMRESIRRLSQLDVEHVLTGHAYGHPGVISGEREVRSNFQFILTAVIP